MVENYLQCIALLTELNSKVLPREATDCRPDVPDPRGEIFVSRSAIIGGGLLLVSDMRACGSK